MAVIGRCVQCTGRAVQRHHVLTRQTLRQYGRKANEWPTAGDPRPTYTQLAKDRRNLVPVCKRCHERHHQAVDRIALRKLPDSVFEFAAELMGAGPAFNYLERTYAGFDPRHHALLEAA